MAKNINGDKSIERKVVLITGASSGIGFEIAKHLSRDGHMVFGTSRKQNPNVKGDFEMLTLDVRSDESVRAAVSEVLNSVGRIDVLINNAGFLLFGFLEEASIEEAKSVFETNFFGLVRMTNAVLPAMRKQRSGHIINIGSLAGLVPTPGMGFYGASKFAIEGYSETLKYELEKFNIRVTIVEPGFSKTNIGHAKDEVKSEVSDYNSMRLAVKSAIENSIRKGGDPVKIARLISGIAEQDSAALRYRIGNDSVWIPRMKTFLPEGAFAWGVRRTFNL